VFDSSFGPYSAARHIDRTPIDIKLRQFILKKSVIGDFRTGQHFL